MRSYQKVHQRHVGSTPQAALLALVQNVANLFDVLALQDVPACIEYVLKHSPTKADKLHWMGHSMVR